MVNKKKKDSTVNLVSELNPFSAMLNNIGRFEPMLSFLLQRKNSTHW